MKKTSQWWCGLVLPAFLGACAGCASWGSQFGHPGSLTEQRNRAVVHDPYIDNDLGPAIPEARPREFSRPLSEPRRNRAFVDSRFYDNY